MNKTPSTSSDEAIPTKERQKTSDATGEVAAVAPSRARVQRSSRTRYIPALDGIRTFAVAAVVLYHLNLSWAQGGFLGVTLFFVLSGYLITRLLLAEFGRSGAIDLKSFWARRIRRLVPATVTLVIVVALLCTLFNHVMLTKMRPDILPSLLFFNNWWQIVQNVSYFDALGDPSPLTHFWSLSIEEQFYVVWPVLLLVLLKLRIKRPVVRRVTLCLAVVSSLVMAVLYNPVLDPSRVYYGTDTRAFSMLLGAWLAFIPERRMNPIPRLRIMIAKCQGKPLPKALRGGAFAGSKALDLMGVVALAGLVAMVAFTNGYTPFIYRGGTLLASLLGLVLIAACVQEGSFLSRMFSSAPLVWLGKRSYSIYLWHYPLLALMNPVSNVSAVPWWMHVVQLAVVLVAAELSYRFIEEPFRHGALGRFLRNLREGKTTVPAAVRRHLVPTTVACAITLAAVGGLVFVPSTSALSDEGAELIQQNAEDGENQSSGGVSEQAGGTTDADEDGFPDDAYDILMIGDSVSLRTVDTFNETFAHGHIDAAKNRQFAAGKELFQGYESQNLAGKVVVFALGTNGPVTDSDIDSLMEAVGGERVCVFITTRSPRQWVQSTNDALKRAAERYDNVRIIDWYAYSEGRSDLFDGDGTHLSSTGAQEYIGLVSDAVKDDLPFRFEGAAREETLQRLEASLQAIRQGAIDNAFGRNDAA